jgi:hypothetical protein
MITLDGTLGITTPAETVQGALTTTGNTILGDATTDTLNVGAGGLVKDASGNVGIGQSFPNAKLQVDSSSATYSANIRVRNPSFGSGVVGVASGILTVATDMNNMAFYTGSNLGVDGTSVPTNERMRIDSSGNLLFNSGYGSAATAYGCRAWVNFNGTGTVAIRASGNVSSITDNGTGDYTVNFTTAMPDANYSFQATLGAENIGTNGRSLRGYQNGASGFTSSSSRMQCYNITSSALQDPDQPCVSIFR